MAGRGDPYPTLPGWLGIYFVSLTVLDPLAAALLLRCKRSGLVLSCAVLLSNAGANGYANYGLHNCTGVTFSRVGHAVLTLMAATFTTAAIQL